mmetsp:Transcript_48592/g.128497  ORF Transcript_48592/g.128497 Transcript_48592/m.128497 type:complete len:156 (+) Transcript_48592:456-923(+)
MSSKNQICEPENLMKAAVQAKTASIASGNGHVESHLWGTLAKIRSDLNSEMIETNRLSTSWFQTTPPVHRQQSAKWKAGLGLFVYSFFYCSRAATISVFPPCSLHGGVQVVGQDSDLLTRRKCGGCRKHPPHIFPLNVEREMLFEMKHVENQHLR